MQKRLIWIDGDDLHKLRTFCSSELDVKRGRAPRAFTPHNNAISASHTSREIRDLPNGETSNQSNRPPRLVPRVSTPPPQGLSATTLLFQIQNKLLISVDEAGNETAYWQSLRDFWTAYFQKSGAILKAYSVLRDLPKLGE
jgi:hypothetical protein